MLEPGKPVAEVIDTLGDLRRRLGELEAELAGTRWAASDEITEAEMERADVAERLREAMSDLRAISDAIPSTFFAGCTLPFRVQQIVRIWRNAVAAAAEDRA